MTENHENIPEENTSPPRATSEASPPVNTVIRRITTAGTIEENDEAAVEDVVQEEVVQTSGSPPEGETSQDDGQESQEAVEYLERSEDTTVYASVPQQFTNETAITTEAYHPQVQYQPFEILPGNGPHSVTVETVDAQPQFASLQPANYNGEYTDGSQYLQQHQYSQMPSFNDNLPLLNRSDPTLASARYQVYDLLTLSIPGRTVFVGTFRKLVCRILVQRL